MGKDIDRNITRQLWERFKNTFSRNDVIPVENGGTGVKDLKVAFQRGINDRYIKQIDKRSITLLNGITMGSNFDAIFELNQNSIAIRNTISLKLNSPLAKGGMAIPAISFPFESESYIENILITNYTRVSIKNGVCILSLFFLTNEYNYDYGITFIPLI